MPPRSQRLEPILRLKQRHQDDVAQQVAAREAVLAEQENRLAALQRYAAEYELQPIQGGVLNPALLANRLAFKDKVQQAVHQQVRVVESARMSSEAERARLMLASREKHVLEKLAASYRADEARAADVRVQKELDDLGGRRARAGGLA